MSLIGQIDEMAKNPEEGEDAFLIYQSAKNAVRMHEARLFASAIAGVLCENTWIKSVDLLLRNTGGVDRQSCEYCDSYSIGVDKIEVDVANLSDNSDAEQIIDNPSLYADALFDEDDRVNEALCCADFAIKKIEQNPPIEVATLTIIPLTIIRLNKDTIQSIRGLYQHEPKVDTFEIFRLIAPAAADDIYAPYRDYSRPRQSDA